MSALFDPETGELLQEGQCPNCAQALRERVVAEQDLQRVERDLRKERREVARLKTELSNRQTQVKEYRAAEALFRYWVARCGKNAKRTVFGEKRRKAVLDALQHHTPEYIARAIDGTAEAPSTNAPERERLALVKVMVEAMKLVTPEQAEALRQTYRDATRDVLRYDELELICRDEVQIERRYEIAERVNAPTLVGQAWRNEFGSEVLPGG